MKRILKPQDETTTQRNAAQKKFTSKSRDNEREQSIAHSPAMTAQRLKLQNLFGGTVQRVEEEELKQGKFATVQRVEEEELKQGKFATGTAMQLKSDSAQSNHTGLPDNLKNGIESLSGMSMDQVRVHYNSSQPANLNALAYAQGSDIHVAPGQEQHLPHEAWHVVQQAQGRVKPTMQMKEGVPINNDHGLEHEADVMGAKALQLKGSHGKHLHFKVTTVTITNSVTHATRFVNANHDEDLGKVPTHGAGPAQKTQQDADAIALGVANLGPNESITNVTWNHYTR